MNNLSITLKETLTLYSFKNLLSICTLGNILFIGGYCIYMFIYIYNCIYIYVCTFASPFEIINIPCTQGDRIHIYIYICVCVCVCVSQYDENLLNIFLICCLKPSVLLKEVIKYSWIALTDISIVASTDWSQTSYNNSTLLVNSIIL